MLLFPSTYVPAPMFRHPKITSIIIILCLLYAFMGFLLITLYDNSTTTTTALARNYAALERSKCFPIAKEIEASGLYSVVYPIRHDHRLVKQLSPYDINRAVSNRRKTLLVKGGLCSATLENKESSLPAIPIAIDTTFDRDCQTFVQEEGYITSPITRLEEDFPIAFSILVYADFRHFTRLLRTIYRPQNSYCIHVDKKSESAVIKSVERLSSCFSNVFVVTPSVVVEWGQFSVLEPELLCIKELLKRYKTWKYFINLTGQELPLRTNYELVKILSAVDGANFVEGTIARANTDRWEGVEPPPHNITPVKGAVHVVLNREFVYYAIHNEKANDFLDWCRKVKIPDEVFFSSLQHNPHLGIRGSYRGNPETNEDTNPYLARFKNWESNRWRCHGKYVRDICIFAGGDYSLLVERRELFANKFFQTYDVSAAECLESLLLNRTLEETFGSLKFDVDYYTSRDFVFNKV